MGTLKYMSPEQARGLSAGERTDIFSLGVVLYEMVAGRPPFEGATSSDVLVALLEKEPRRLSREGTELPAALEQVVSRALAKDASKRYPTMKDLLNELRDVKRGLEVAPRRAGLDFRVAVGVAIALGLTAAARRSIS
jgi:serine/threonine-protein kinase